MRHDLSRNFEIERSREGALNSYDNFTIEDYLFMTEKDEDKDQYHEQEKGNDQPQKPLGFFTIVGSVLSVFLGVQSSARRERDFKQGNFKYYFVGGVIYGILLLAGLICLVQYIAGSVQ